MKTRPGQKIQIKSVEELLGVVNEEAAMDIEIYKITSFADHPFKVVDDEKMQELVESLVSIFSIFHGFWKVFFTLITILAIAFGMYQNALIFVGVIAVTFVILIAGAAVDLLLEEARKRIGRVIIA